MAGFVSFGDQRISLSNRHFSNLLEFTLASVNEDVLNAAERLEFLRLKKEFEDGRFWPGRGLTVEEDLADIEQKKLWARLFADAARAIFRREVGFQGNTCWQARAISQAMQVSDLLVDAVRQTEKGWYPETQDQMETASLYDKRVPR